MLVIEFKGVWLYESGRITAIVQSQIRGCVTWLAQHKPQINRNRVSVVQVSLRAGGFEWLCRNAWGHAPPVLPVL